MNANGFTFLEILVGIGILATALILAFPSYRNNTNTRTAQGAALALEFALEERKMRGAALGTSTGLCIGSHGVKSYEAHPFVSGSVLFKEILDLDHRFGRPVVLSVIPSVPPPSFNPCGTGESQIWMAPSANTAGDWEGTVIFQTDSSRWRLTAGPGGKFSDGP